MSNPVVRKLQETLDQLEAQIAELQKQRDGFREVLAYYGDHPDALETRTAPAKEVRNAMWEILKHEGKPLHFKDIYDRLIEHGVRVAGKEPARNVGAHLSADERFRSLGQGRWGLQSWPLDIVPKVQDPLKDVGDARIDDDGADTGSWPETAQQRTPVRLVRDVPQVRAQAVNDSPRSRDEFDDLDDVPF
jgi:hypothetical protein